MPDPPSASNRAFPQRGNAISSTFDAGSAKSIAIGTVAGRICFPEPHDELTGPPMPRPRGRVVKAERLGTGRADYPCGFDAGSTTMRKLGIVAWRI